MDKKIGIICNWLPYPIYSGSNFRLAELIKSISNIGYKVDLVVIGDLNSWRYRYLFILAKRKLAVSDIFYITSRSSKLSLIGLFKSLYWVLVDSLIYLGFPNIDHFIVDIKAKLLHPPSICKNNWNDFSNVDTKNIEQLAKKQNWCAVIVEYLWLHSVIDKLPNSIKRIIDTHDVMHIRHQHLISLTLHSPFPIDEKTEAHLLDKFDCVLAIQDQENKIFNQLKIKYNLNYKVLTVGVSSNPKFRNPKKIEKKKNIILCVGGFNSFNIEGLKDFLENYWHDIYCRHKSWELHICGRICQAFTGCKREGVVFVGYANDLSSHYHSANIVINPNWLGTGLKIKTIEAISYGKALITTPVGVEGMNLEINNCCFVANNRNEFVEMLEELMTTPEKIARLEMRSTQYFDRYLSPEVVYKEINEFLSNL